MIVLITGTNTDVGKTYATAEIARQAVAAGKKVMVIKPAQTGEPEGHGDIFTIRALVPEVDTQEFIRYPEPLSPHLAAKRAGMEELDLHEVAGKIRSIAAEYDCVLVEGAGGLLVRIAHDWTIADLAVELEAPLIIVTGTRLGSLNSAELSVEAATARGIRVEGLIGGRVSQNPDLAEQLNCEELGPLTGVPYLGSIPEGAWEKACVDLSSTSIFCE